MQNARAMQAEMDARMAKQSQAEDLNQNKTQNAVESPMMVDGWSYVPLTEEIPITQTRQSEEQPKVKVKVANQVKVEKVKEKVMKLMWGSVWMLTLI